MRRALSVAVTALLLAACGTQPQAARPVAGSPAKPSAPARQAVAATATPATMPVLPGLLAVGARQRLQATPLFPETVLVCNPAGSPAAVSLAVSGGTSTPAPSAAPASSAPSAEPTAAAPSSDGGGFEFGFGSAGSDFTRQPLTAARKLAAVAAPTSFWINDGDATLGGDRLVPVTARPGGPDVDFYVDRSADATVSADAVAKLKDAFENRILPRLQPVFGTPNLAAGERFSVVLSPWVGQAPGRSGMLGYFWPRDVLQRGGTGTDLRQHSNQRRVVFLSTTVLDKPDVTSLGTLAHEYQHLLMFDMKSRSDGQPHPEDTWLDEGCSMLAMDLAGYGLNAGDPFVAGEVAAFEQDPGAYSLTDWKDNPNGYSYGLSYLFVRYLTDRFGPGIIAEIQATPATGVQGLQAVLAKHGTSFPQVFVDWANAVVKPAGPGDFDAAGTYGGTKLPGLQARAADNQSNLAVRPWGILPVGLDSGSVGDLVITTLAGAIALERPDAR